MLPAYLLNVFIVFLLI